MENKMNKSYTIEYHQENGVVKMKRTNYGFNAFELLGLLTFVQMEIKETLEGNIEPDIIERIVLKDSEQPE